MTPHTPDPAAGAPAGPPGMVDTTVPNSARIWNYWLGGKDNYEADRQAGDDIFAICPQIPEMAREGRRFLGRAVRYATSQGIRQFLDIGCGLPLDDNTHQIAQQAARDARVVYVDNDPVVLAHARALLDNSTPEGACAYVDADLRDPDRILAEAAATLDPDLPVAVVLCGVLPHITDDAEAISIVRRLMDGVPAGSLLVFTHDTGDYDIPGAGSPSIVEAMDLFADGGGPRLTARTREQVTRFVEGLELVEPGIISTSQWRPRPSPHEPLVVPQYGGVARKP